MSENKTSSRIIISLLATLIFVLTFIFISRGPSQQSIPKELVAVMRPAATSLKPFTLTDKNEKPFNLQNLKGKWSFVFFGYTHCPDICPTTLHVLKQINKILSKHPQAKKEFQVVFVSVDPERDTPKGLGEYVSFFNKDFIGVTGNSEALLSFARQFSAAYIKEPADKSGDYLVSHTSSIFLVNPAQKLLASFSPPLVAETITEQYLKIYNMNL